MYQVEKSFIKSLIGLADSKILYLSKFFVPFELRSWSGVGGGLFGDLGVQKNGDLTVEKSPS